jgi:hypothetical protein
MIEEGIDCDPAQPRVEGRVKPESTQSLIRFKPDFLGEVFGVLFVVTIMKSEQIDATPVTLRERAKRLGVEGLSASYEIGFAVRQE